MANEYAVKVANSGLFESLLMEAKGNAGIPLGEPLSGALDKDEGERDGAKAKTKDGAKAKDEALKKAIEAMVLSDLL